MALSWIIITVLVIVGIVTIRLNHLKHRFFIILLVLLALFLYTSLSLVTVQNDLDLKSSGGIFSATKVYVGWLANGFQNLKSLTGKAFDLDWKSANSTFFEKDQEDKKPNSKLKTNRIRR